MTDQSLNCCWSSTAQSFLVFGPVGTPSYFSSFQTFYVFWNGASSSTRGRIWLPLVTSALLLPLTHSNSWLDSYFILWPSRVRVRVRVTLRLTVYRQSVRLDAKPREAHDQRLMHGPWIQLGPKPRMTVLARISSTLPDRQTDGCIYSPLASLGHYSEEKFVNKKLGTCALCYRMARLLPGKLNVFRTERDRERNQLRSSVMS
jgi:hypothetical protein